MALGNVPEVKTCRQCGQPFRRKMRQASGWWAGAKFCSATCAQEARRPPELSCRTCGVIFRPKHGPKRGAKFCSIQCSAAAQRVAEPKSRYRQTKVGGRKILEHRLVMEKRLGRRLLSEEVVHHKNEAKLDNSDANLEMTTAREHGLLHNPPTRPVTSDCVICGTTFTPHKTKRGRKQTCSPACKSVLLRQRWPEHHPRPSSDGRP